ncbi:MAG: hypothetical protein QM582_03175 [Micropruina sp.]|uniref:hypothetical protein n=1 Tax=Micropruina sp. TaxID=2737536 RepID=UPI0039E46AC7
MIVGRAVRLLAALLFGLALVLVPGQPDAAAIPPGGPGPSTPGTSSSVSPRSLQAGGVIRFTLRGFPRGEIVYIKIDDGRLCSNTSHGACVYHSQKIPSSGVVNGSFRLPKSLKPGSHSLRFLASAYVDPKNPGKGTKGYTNRSPSFTITSGGSSGSKQPGGNGGGSTTSPGSSGTSTTTASPGTVAKPGAGTKATQPATVPTAPAVDALAADKAGSVRAAVTGDSAVLTVGTDYAGEWAFVYAYSEPTPLGWRQVAADGTVNVATGALPAGEHRFAVLDADGKLLGWTAAAVGATASATPVPSPSATPVAPAPVEAGPSVGVWVLIGAVLLVGVGLIVVLVRRRAASGTN